MCSPYGFFALAAFPDRHHITASHFWDISAVAALDKAVLKFRREGTSVEIIGLNEASATMIDRFGVHDKPGAEAAPGAH